MTEAAEKPTQKAARNKLGALMKAATHQTLKADLKVTGKAQGKEGKEPSSPAPASSLVSQDEITAMMARAGILPHDEMYAILFTFLKIAQTLEQGTDALNSRVKATADAETERVKDEVLEIEAGSVERMTQVLDLSAKAMARGMLWRTGAMIGGVLFLTATIAGIGGYLVGEDAGRKYMTQMEGRVAAAFKDGADAAELWLRLMDANDVKAALDQCKGKYVRDQQGRSACYVPLWIDPPARTP